MRLSSLVGIPTPHVEVYHVLDQSSYMVERFDKDRGQRVARRVHTEDFAQAAGIPGEGIRKYDMSAGQAVKLLRQADPSDELIYEFIERLAFNVSVANADAHAKNYSLFIRPDGITMAPMYDTLVTKCWPWINDNLAMGISGVRQSSGITEDHWLKIARQANLDENRVGQIASQVASRIIDKFDDAFIDVHADVRDWVREVIAEANKNMPTNGPNWPVPEFEYPPLMGSLKPRSEPTG